MFDDKKGELRGNVRGFAMRELTLWSSIDPEAASGSIFSPLSRIDKPSCLLTLTFIPRRNLTELTLIK